MAGIAPTTSLSFQANAVRLDAAQQQKAPSADQPEAQAKFQEFVAGTFYKLMLKSLRNGQQAPKYLNGGQAEKIFQGQLDDQFSGIMAQRSGAAISGPLYPAFARRAFGGETGQVSAPGFPTAHPSPATQELAHVLDVTQ